MLKILPSEFSLWRYGLYVRFVNESDAEFILKLRTDTKLGKYINATEPNISKQIEWIREYKQRESTGTDYYFMFERPTGNRLGVCRIYDIEKDKFTIGSWIFSPSAPIGSSILGDIITREIAYELFPNSTLLFDVRKDNINVIKYQESYKPQLLKEDSLTNYYCCSKDNFEKYKKGILRMFNTYK